MNFTWYVSNQTLHKDVNVPVAEEERRRRAEKHFVRLQSHPNEVMPTLTQTINPGCLKRIWPHKPRD